MAFRRECFKDHKQLEAEAGRAAAALEGEEATLRAQGLGDVSAYRSAERSRRKQSMHLRREEQQRVDLLGSIEETKGKIAADQERALRLLDEGDVEAGKEREREERRQSMGRRRQEVARHQAMDREAAAAAELEARVRGGKDFAALLESCPVEETSEAEEAEEVDGDAGFCEPDCVEEEGTDGEEEEAGFVVPEGY